MREWKGKRLYVLKTLHLRTKNIDEETAIMNVSMKTLTRGLHQPGLQVCRLRKTDLLKVKHLKRRLAYSWIH